MDSNHRKQTLADLQSAPFDRSGTYPLFGIAGCVQQRAGALYTFISRNASLFFIFFDFSAILRVDER